MNKVILMGRLTRDPEVRYTNAAEPIAVARYSLAVNRKHKREGQPDADFVNCIGFGSNGEFAEKYFKKGQQVGVIGRLQTGSYEKDGVKHYTTDVVIEEQYFAGGKGNGENTNNTPGDGPDGFYPINENIEDDDLPF